MTIALRADAAADGALHHFWFVCPGAGRAAEGLCASWQEQLGKRGESRVVAKKTEPEVNFSRPRGGAAQCHSPAPLARGALPSLAAIGLQGPG